MTPRRNFSRNTLDVRDRVQVRIVRKRLKARETQLADIFRKPGASVSATGKVASLRPCLSLPRHTPSAALISANEQEAAPPVQPEAI
jgi:hypothetical protein